VIISAVNKKNSRKKLETKLLKQIYALKELKNLNNGEDLKAANYKLQIDRLKLDLCKSGTVQKSL